MRLCRVLGPVVATVEHPKFQGPAIFAVQPLDVDGAPSGASFVAMDHAQAGVGDVVLVLTEGNGTRQILGDPQGPVRSMIVGIVDAVELEADG